MDSGIHASPVPSRPSMSGWWLTFTKCRYLKNIDKFHEWTVSVWLTPGGNSSYTLTLLLMPLLTTHTLLLSKGMKLILLHELKNDDGHRVFLHEVWEAYVKHLLNPFHEINAPVRSLAFDARVKAAAKKSL